MMPGRDWKFLLYGAPPYNEWEANYGTPRCVSADPEMFFAEKGRTNRAAKDLCDQCPCKQPCLEYALGLPATDDFGVWGGTSERQREALRNGYDSPYCGWPKCTRRPQVGGLCEGHARADVLAA